MRLIQNLIGLCPSRRDFDLLLSHSLPAQMSDYFTIAESYFCFDPFGLATDSFQPCIYLCGACQCRQQLTTHPSDSVSILTGASS